MYINDAWLINTKQHCPLLTFEEHLVYSLDKVVSEFNELGASFIYYNDIYVYTDLNPKDKINEDPLF